MYAVECVNCGRSAFEDYYYNTGEKYICCYRCGYNYAKTIIIETADGIKYKEVSNNGYGVFLAVKKDGNRCLTYLNCELTAEEIDNFRMEFFHEDSDQARSYLVTFKEGIFTTHFGYPTENFYLSFEKYKEKMIGKYGELYEDVDILVPMEE